MFEQFAIETEQVRANRLSRPLPRLASALSLLCAVILLLSGCGSSADNSADNEEDRRFANDPSEGDRSTVEPTVPIATEPAAATPAGQPLPAADTLLRARGAPATVYAILNDEIQSIQISGGQATARTIPPPDGARFVAIDSSPSGDRVAAVTVIVNGADAPRIDLQVFDGTGAVTETWSGMLSPDTAVGTPVAGQAGPTTQPPDIDVMVDWGSQGNRIAVATPGGRIASATLGGDVAPIATPEGIVAVGDIEWSPRGDRLAVLGTSGDGIPRIGLIDPEADAGQFLPVAPLDDGAEPDRIRSFAWLPDGSGLVYLAGGDGAEAVGGQLFSLDLETMSERLVATAGRGGPSATISDFSLSPDGKSVAYTIVLPDGGDWRFNSLWVRSLRDQRALSMPVGNVLEVNAVWWVDRGILWGQAVREGGAIQESFIRLEPGGDPITVLDVRIGGQDDAGATPGATPAATPVG